MHPLGIHKDALCSLQRMLLIDGCVIIYHLCFSGSVHYDEGESEAESMTSNIDMSNPIFQLYEAVRGARNSQGQLISEPFLQLPSRKDYPDYYHQISQPICLHQIKYDNTATDLTQCVCACLCPQRPVNADFMFWLFFCLFLFKSPFKIH